MLPRNHQEIWRVFANDSKVHSLDLNWKPKYRPTSSSLRLWSSTIFLRALWLTKTYQSSSRPIPNPAWVQTSTWQFSRTKDTRQTTFRCNWRSWTTWQIYLCGWKSPCLAKTKTTSSLWSSKGSIAGSSKVLEKRLLRFNCQKRNPDLREASSSQWKSETTKILL